MTKVYVLIYDHDHGNREDCNIFYSPIEVFADAETREKRIELLAKTNDDIGFRTEDLELATIHDFDIPENLLPYEDEDDEDDEDDRPDMRDYEPPEDPSGYCFYVHEAPDMFGDEDDDPVTTVAITPIDYFKQTGYMYDQHCNFDLPDGFDEIAEGYVVYDGTMEEAREKLLALGLVEDADFAKLIQSDLDQDSEDDNFGKVLSKNWGSVDPDTDFGIETAPPKPFADYVFAIGLTDDAWDDTEKVTTVYVAKREDFEKNGKLSEDSLPIRMPWGFGEINSGRYEYDGSIVVGKQLLEDLGMQTDAAFTDYCRANGLEVGSDFENRITYTANGDMSVDLNGLIGPNGEINPDTLSNAFGTLFNKKLK